MRKPSPLQMKILSAMVEYNRFILQDTRPPYHINLDYAVGKVRLSAATLNSMIENELIEENDDGGGLHVVSSKGREVFQKYSKQSIN